MTNKWSVFAALALVACGGKALGDGENSGSAGQSAGGSTSQGGSTSASGAASTGGAPSITHCIGHGGPPSLVRFQFESIQTLWVRLGCSLEYTVAKTCQGKLTPITPQTFCAEECGAGAVGCNECGACPSEVSEVGQGIVEIAAWDGFVYTSATSSSGCECYNRLPAASGVYQVAITAFLSPEDAVAGRNGYHFSTAFTYPATDIVHVHLDFLGL